MGLPSANKTNAPDYIEEDPFFKNRIRAPYTDDMAGARLAGKKPRK